MSHCNRGVIGTLLKGLCALQSTKYLLELGKFHRLSGIPHDYFGVMGTIFVHAVRPYWEEAGCMSEQGCNSIDLGFRVGFGDT